MNYLKKSLFALCLLALLPTFGRGLDASAQSVPGSKPSDVVDEDNDSGPTQSPHSANRSSATLSVSRGDELTLGDVRDSGIALNQVRQESINIFLEATRTVCDKTTRSDLSIPNSITEKDLEAATRISSYQAPRPKWLFYYVGTLEPVISMLSQDVHNAKSGISKMLVPAGSLDSLKPLWLEWSTGIIGINNELTDISKIVDSTQLDNAALAKHAFAMYKLTESLEHTRERAFVVTRDASKHGDSSEKVNLPSEK